MFVLVERQRRFSLRRLSVEWRSLPPKHAAAGARRRLCSVLMFVCEIRYDRDCDTRDDRGPSTYSRSESRKTASVFI